VQTRERGSFIDSPWPLGYFKITTLLALNLKTFFCSNIEYYFEWLVMKTTGTERGGDESCSAEKSCSPNRKVVSDFFKFQTKF